MGQETYAKATLRDQEKQRMELTSVDVAVRHRFDVKEENSASESISRILQNIAEPVLNTWLVRSNAKLEQLAVITGVTRGRALTVRAGGPFTYIQTNDQRAGSHMSLSFYALG